MSEMVHAIRGLLGYTMWADRTLLETLRNVSQEDLTRETGTSFGSLLGTMAHILGSEQLWLSRFLGVPLTQVPGIDDFPNSDALAASFEDFWPQLEFFIASLTAEQIDQEFVWTNLRGETHSVVFRHVLLHFVNHATYHRGQVVSLLRQLGHEPPHTDLVYYRGGL
ncbi:MAG: DinB family protein [Thermoanaerobaculia bacterium]